MNEGKDRISHCTIILFSSGFWTLASDISINFCQISNFKFQ